MAIVNFSIPKTLETKINHIIKEDGFSSKAEFFRFSVLSYIQNRLGKKETLQESVTKLNKLFTEKLKGADMNKWPSGEEQLRDLL